MNKNNHGGKRSGAGRPFGCISITKSLLIRLTPELKARLKQESIQRCQTMNGVIIDALESFLQN